MSNTNEYPEYKNITEVPYTFTLIRQVFHAKKYGNEKKISETETRLKSWLMNDKTKVLTFKAENEAINYTIDKNIIVNIEKFENDILSKGAHYSKENNTIFLIDQHGILTTD